MTIAIQVHTDGGLDKFVKSLKKKRDLPQMTSDGMLEWGKILERDMKTSLIGAGVRPMTGKLLGRGIRWEQRPKGNVGRLLIYKYGIQLDSMPPHKVSIRSSRTVLTRWALQAQSPSIRRIGRSVAMGQSKGTSIYVRPHPFIATGYARARPKLNAIIKRHQRRAFA